MTAPANWPVVVVVAEPGDGDWWSAPISALSALGVPTRRVAVTPPASGPAAPEASDTADLDALLLTLLHHRVTLVGAGYAAAVIVDFLAAGPRSSVTQIVLVEPRFSPGPGRAAEPTPATTSAAVSALHQLHVPVFLARSRVADGFAPDSSVVPDPGGVIVRVYQTLTESDPETTAFVDDLLDFVGSPAPS